MKDRIIYDTDKPYAKIIRTTDDGVSSVEWCSHLELKKFFSNEKLDTGLLPYGTIRFIRIGNRFRVFIKHPSIRTRISVDKTSVVLPGGKTSLEMMMRFPPVIVFLSGAEASNGQVQIGNAVILATKNNNDCVYRFPCWNIFPDEHVCMGSVVQLQLAPSIQALEGWYPTFLASKFTTDLPFNICTSEFLEDVESCDKFPDKYLVPSTRTLENLAATQ